MKTPRPIHVRQFIKVRGEDAYRERTDEEIKEAAQKAIKRRAANRLAKEIMKGPRLVGGNDA
jgi:hypothetical protein